MIYAKFTFKSLNFTVEEKQKVVEINTEIVKVKKNTSINVVKIFLKNITITYKDCLCYLECAKVKNELLTFKCLTCKNIRKQRFYNVFVK